MHRTSGWFSTSQASTRSCRARIELTFHVASFTRRLYSMVPVATIAADANPAPRSAARDRHLEVAPLGERRQARVVGWLAAQLEQTQRAARALGPVAQRAHERLH